MDDTKSNVDKLILDNQKLIYKVIKDLKCYWKTEDEFQNLYDAGLEGLIRGAKAYDGTTTPGTYLYTCIKNMICREFYVSEQLNKRINKEIMISLNAEISDDSDETYLDFIEDTTINLEEDLLKKLEIERILNAIDKILTPLQKEFTCHYYGINGYIRMNYRELAKKYNCSHQNAMDKVRKSVRKLKRYLEKNKGEAFMEEYRVRKGMKRCIKCNQNKPIEEFDFSTENKKYRKPYCKECEQKHYEMFIQPEPVRVPKKETIKESKENTLSNLNDILFNQLKKLESNDVDIENELRKSYAVSQLAQQIINNANTCIKAVQLTHKYEIKDTKSLSFIGTNNDND